MKKVGLFLVCLIVLGVAAQTKVVKPLTEGTGMLGLIVVNQNI